MGRQARDTQARILAAAKAEFLEKGFQRASLRSIVQAAGVTTGALYGYYSSKEALFNSFVGDVYRYIVTQFKDTLSAFKNLPMQEQREKLGTFSSACMQKLLGYMYAHLQELRLLLLCAEGTQYAHMKEELIALEIEATHEYYRTLSRLGQPVPDIDKRLEHVLVAGLINAYFEMMVYDMPLLGAERRLNKLLDFYNAGWCRLMGQ